MGNHWILLRFANAEDKLLVFDQRPYFVNGLNFVLKPWVEFFDPYQASLDRVDQWLRIPRLPWEFWEREALQDLLKHVGDIVRIDQNTLLRLKGKFARVCANIDITHPLPGSLSISRGGLSTRVSLIYEGLHEVCPLCGGESHQLEACPNLPVSKKIEVLIERFDAQGVSQANKGVKSNPTSNINSGDTWVSVSPKKRVRPSHNTKSSKVSNLNPLSSKASPNLTQGHANQDMPINPPAQSSNPAPGTPKGVILANPAANAPILEPILELDHLEAFNEDLLDDMEAETHPDLYLNLHNFEDIEMSSDSAKRKREEDGEEATSQAP